MLQANGSPLVSGTPTNHMEQPKKRHVRVLRAFYVNGKATKVGEVIEMDRRFASELFSFNKVEYVDPPKPAEAPKVDPTKGKKE